MFFEFAEVEVDVCEGPLLSISLGVLVDVEITSNNSFAHCLQLTRVLDNHPLP